MRPLIPLGLFCLVFAVPDSPKILQEFAAKVISVTDGDTLTVLVERQQVKIRLEGIDAPEKSQAFGARSQAALSKLLKGKTVLVQVTGKDRYERLLARVKVGNSDVSAEMLKLGMAWHYKEYSDDEELSRLEIAAHARRLGLWSESNALPPWEYRSRQKQPVAVAQNPPSSGSRSSSSSANTTGTHWLNTSGNVRHNSSCQYFQNTKKGHLCGPTDGKACGKCGG